MSILIFSWKKLSHRLVGLFLLLTPIMLCADNSHLSKNVIPQKYTLCFEPDLKQFTFAGTEKINLRITSETRSITLNGLELIIKKAVIRSSSEIKSVQRATTVYDKKKQRITFHFPTAVKPGEYTLECTFTGILNDQLHGFYRSSYGAKKKHWLATTQMEPADARRMFPCFDEPDFKARFQITALIAPHLIAISNAPIMKEKNRDGKKEVTFQETPIMSTYLVALIVGDLRRAGTTIDANGVPLSIWTTPGKEHLGQTALNMARAILPIEARYFGIPYPGKKLDLIALPDFSMGAMENLGAITFRENALLFDEKTGTTLQKQRIASIEAHEIAHQWFGDLVTMKWWDDLWLNEAFATWMATKTIEALHPTWRFLSQSILDYNEAKDDDQLRNTRALHAPVLNTNEAQEMFDSITYEKGAGLLRMLEYFIGEKNFQRAIHAYLTKHAYSNATTHDLWKQISLASGSNIPVDTMMNSWVYQAGFPLLTASLQQDGKAMTIEQTRFFGAADAKSSTQHWRVPVVMNDLIKPDKGKKIEPEGVKKLLLSKTKTLNVTDAPVFINKDGAGFYRVQYAPRDFNLIIQHFSSLSAEEKLVFVSDTLALAIADKMPIEKALNLLLKIREETDPLVQITLVKAFNMLIPTISSTSNPAFERLLQHNLRPLKIYLGWLAQENESVLHGELRNTVVEMLGTYGQDRQTIEEAFKLFHQYLQHPASINQNILPALLRIVSFNGNENDYETMALKWHSATNPEDEKRFLLTLARFNQPSLIMQTLNLSLSKDVRGQDRAALLSTLLKRKESQAQAWSFIQSHWSKILASVPEVELSDIPASCDSFYTQSAENELRSFFMTHEIPYGKSTVARMLEKVHINVLFQENDAERIRRWCNLQQ